MKRIFTLGLLAGGLLVRPLLATADPMISVGSATVAPGGAASLTVSLNGEVQNVNGVEIHLNHSVVTPANGPALTLAALDKTALPAQLSDAMFDSNDADGVFHAAFVNADSFNGPLTLATIKAQVPANATPGATYTLTLTAKLTDSDGKPITATTQGGTITVEGTLPTPTKGDVNGDGKVSVPDATLALRYAVSLATPSAAQLAAADINGDGSVKVADVTQILRAAVGLITL
jgi:hypothetical protein